MGVTKQKTKSLWRLVHRWGAPQVFYDDAHYIIRWLTPLTLILLGYGLIGGLFLAPADFQQGDGFRIIYVHVPCAFLSLAIYAFMVIWAIISFVWKLKIADILVKVSAPIGAWFTFLALATGSIWGKPMWGTFWVWDARLTSELILLFIYFAIIGLRNAIPDIKSASQACNLLVLVGSVNLPIIHYSVYWWHTLHQGNTLRLTGPSLIAPAMLYPLLAMITAFFGYFGILVLWRARCEILWRERRTRWVKERFAI